MRLTNCRTLRFKEFVQDILPYAVLSHMWDKDELTFSDVDGGNRIRMQKVGLGKIIRTCRLALEEGIDYAWVDTCCIDKSSSAELSEAINSMFAWYRDSAVCYAWLSDFKQEPGMVWENIIASFDAREALEERAGFHNDPPQLTVGEVEFVHSFDHQNTDFLSQSSSSCLPPRKLVYAELGSRRQAHNDPLILADWFMYLKHFCRFRGLWEQVNPGPTIPEGGQTFREQTTAPQPSTSVSFRLPVAPTLERITQQENERRASERERLYEQWESAPEDTRGDEPPPATMATKNELEAQLEQAPKGYPVLVAESSSFQLHATQPGVKVHCEYRGVKSLSSITTELEYTERDATIREIVTLLRDRVSLPRNPRIAEIRAEALGEPYMPQEALGKWLGGMPRQQEQESDMDGSFAVTLGGRSRDKKPGEPEGYTCPCIKDGGASKRHKWPLKSCNNVQLAL
ncbi:Uu.00g079080.m01.CDS01 [Anthostomella pinea]|uniref:Uu.00g079080.m01.CDS01 n=1 Tax=Anthostomella pinea TaxID=933095 RepID=A0AAI8YJ78_9PEZI|nr:Uu.00g079080.m01.CDS01 [Anthostomella pinea]